MIFYQLISLFDIRISVNNLIMFLTVLISLASTYTLTISSVPDGLMNALVPGF